MRYTDEQKLEIVTVANGAMPGRLYDWGDFEKYIHERHGESGLSRNVLLRALKQSGLVDQPEVGQLLRKRNAT